MIRGNIVFVQGTDAISKIIRYFDKGKFSHVALAVSPTNIVEANIGIRSRIDKFDPTQYAEVDIIDLGLSFEDREKIMEVIPKYLNRKYDKLQIVWYVLKKIFHLKGKNFLNNPNNLICSELVFDILNAAGILKELGIDEDYRGIDLTPNQLYDLVKYVSKSRT